MLQKSTPTSLTEEPFTGVFSTAASSGACSRQRKENQDLTWGQQQGMLWMVPTLLCSRLGFSPTAFPGSCFPRLYAPSSSIPTAEHTRSGCFSQINGLISFLIKVTQTQVSTFLWQGWERRGSIPGSRSCIPAAPQAAGMERSLPRGITAEKGRSSPRRGFWSLHEHPCEYPWSKFHPVLPGRRGTHRG